MKLQGTPEEIQEAKDWWAQQKDRIDKEYQEAQKKDKNAKKDKSLVSPESKERTYRRHEVNFSTIQGDKSQKHLDNYLERKGTVKDDRQKEIDDAFTAKVMYRTIYRFEKQEQDILLAYMQGTTQKEIAKDIGISASALNQRLKVLLENYRVMLCNDPEFRRTKQARTFHWETKTAFKKYIEEIRQTGKFKINLDQVQDLIKEVQQAIKRTINTGADKNIKQKLSKQIDYSNLDDEWIKNTNKVFADYGIEAHFEKLKSFKGNVMQVLKMVDDFINELRKNTLK